MGNGQTGKAIYSAYSLEKQTLFYKKGLPKLFLPRLGTSISQTIRLNEKNCRVQFSVE